MAPPFVGVCRYYSIMSRVRQLDDKKDKNIFNIMINEPKRIRRKYDREKYWREEKRTMLKGVVPLDGCVKCP